VHSQRIRNQSPQGKTTMKDKNKALFVISGFFFLGLCNYASAQLLLEETVYVDGKLLGSALVVGTGLSYTYDRITIGAEGNRWWMYNQLIGGIDEFAVYAGVLDSERILAHYNATATDYVSEVAADNPLLYLRFEDADMNDGAIAADLGSVGRDGTYISRGGMNSISPIPSEPGLGQAAYLGQAANSDGNGDCVDIWDGDEALSLDEITVELWLNSSNLGTNWPRLFQHNGNWLNEDGYGLMCDAGTFGIIGGGTTNHIGQNVNDGVWHHIVTCYEMVGTGPVEPNAEGIVDANTIYQEVEGFGASGAWYTGALVSHPQKETIYDIIFGQLGLDIYRIRNTFEIDAGTLSNSAQIVQAAENSLGHPIKVMVSSWSPPAYLKSNGQTSGGGESGTATLKQYPGGGYMYDEFAQWWADSLEVYDAFGIVPEYINIQNEPGFLADHDSCKFTPSETEDWAGYNLAFEAVYAELNSRMTEPPAMLAPETLSFSAAGSYIDTLIDEDHVYGFAHHLYGDGNYDYPDGFVTDMNSFTTQYDYKPLFQTEYSRLAGDNGHNEVINLAEHIHNSFVVEGVSAYLHWRLFWGGTGGLVTLNNPDYTIRRPYYAFKQYSAFIYPGWQRVETSTDSNGLRVSAFRSPGGDKLSVMVINVADIDIDLTLSLGGYDPDISEVYRTSPTENTVLIGTFNESQPLALPARSITTLSLRHLLTTCAQVQLASYALTSDISGDCYVNYKDLDIITDYWLASGCSGLNDCNGADFEPDGDVDFADFGMFGLQWAQCNNPEDASCTANW